MKRRKITSFLLVLTLIFSLLTGTTLAQENSREQAVAHHITHDAMDTQTTGAVLSQDTSIELLSQDALQNEQETVSAYVRIEGDTDTFIPKTRVEVEDFDLSEYDASKSYDGISAIQAIIRALEVSGLDAKDENVISHGNGSYISSVCGLEAGMMSGWMYTLNGESPNLGVNQQEIKDGDQIVLYFIEDWMQSSYAYFTEEEREVAGGETVELTLMHQVLDMNTWESQAQPCNGASILVDGEVVGETDEEGKITLDFSEKGTYYVSANKIGEDGVNLISRPYCKVSVTSDPVDGTVLKALKITSSEAKLNPEFSGDITNYSMELPANISEFSSYPVAEDVNSEVYAIASWDEERLTMSDTGEIRAKDIPIGKSTLTYVAEATNGETRNYVIEINRLVAPEEDVEEDHFNYKEAITSAQRWIQRSVDFSSATYKVGSTPDWNAFALVRSGEILPDSYYEGMKSMISSYENVEAFKAAMKKVTEYERMAIGITASGHDATNVAGVDFIERIYNSEVLTNQGVNGVTYGLLAIDSHQYQVPSDALYTREEMVDILLAEHIIGEGWGYSKKASDIDLTAMTIQALTPYYKDSKFAKQSQVKSAVDEAIAYLSSVQQADGTYKSYGNSNPESVAQVIVALSGLGIDCQQDARFIKGDHTLITVLGQFYNKEDGGFKHTIKQKASDAMATQQVLYGLASYERLLNGQNNLYDLTDISIEKNQTDSIDLKNQEIATLRPNYEEIRVNVDKDFKEVILDISQVATNMPKVAVTFDENQIVLPKGIQLVGEENKLALKVLETSHFDSYKEQLEQEFKELETIKYAFDFGNEGHIECDKFISFVFKDKADYEAGYIDSTGKVHRIVKEPASVEGLSEYCVVQGKDLVIKTKHLTTFFIYSTKITNDEVDKPNTEDNTSGPENNGPNPGIIGPDNGNTTQKIKVQISVDAETINRGYLVSPRQIQLEKGATAYDALVSLGLQLDTTGANTTVYVAAINGLGEFDHGTLSGWMYSVNGVFPDVSLGSYILSEGDVIKVRYTTNGGKDLGDAAASLFEGYATATDINKSKVPYSTALAESIKVLEGKSTLTEWELIGLAHKQKLTETAKKALTAKIVEAKGEYRKVTDLERMIIALGAAGYDAQNIEGINLIQKLYDRDSVTNQGSNGVIFALIALDSRQYQVPSEAKWTREKLIQTLLEYQNTDGGFELAKGEGSNIDITAMALCALAPYKEEQKASIDKALAYLSKAQKTNGEFSYQGVESSESTAQVIIALCTLGINPLEDTRFIKEENHLIQVLLGYYVDKQGFKHTKEGQVNQMATEQATLALLSYEKLLQKGKAIYHFDKAEAPVKEVEVPKAQVELSLDQFKDSSEISAWAVEDIQKAVSLGIIQGNGQMIKPKDKVTRAEFVTMLLNVLDQEESDIQASTTNFKDVSDTAWYSEAVYKANRLQLVKGISDEYFMPSTAITREQMAVILSRLIDDKSVSKKPLDIDKVANWAQSSVEVVYSNGLMQGDHEKFEPKQKVTREMAIVILMRFYENNKIQKVA